jgi:hypothetical protein
MRLATALVMPLVIADHRRRCRVLSVATVGNLEADEDRCGQDIDYRAHEKDTQNVQ